MSIVQLHVQLIIPCNLDFPELRRRLCQPSNRFEAAVGLVSGTLGYQLFVPFLLFKDLLELITGIVFVGWGLVFFYAFLRTPSCSFLPALSDLLKIISLILGEHAAVLFHEILDIDLNILNILLTIDDPLLLDTKLCGQLLDGSVCFDFVIEVLLYERSLGLLRHGQLVL